MKSMDVDVYNSSVILRHLVFWMLLTLVVTMAAFFIMGRVSLDGATIVSTHSFGENFRYYAEIYLMVEVLEVIISGLKVIFSRK